MNRGLADAVVRCLAVSGATDDDYRGLARYGRRDWGRTLPWLDTAGLALYLFERLVSAGATGVLPPAVAERLRQNLADNHRRVNHMAERFAFLNRRFEQVGVRYAVIKGFALIPEFCPDARLRHQADLDYLIDAPSIPGARSVLEEAGYSLRARTPTDLVFWRPSERLPTAHHDIYRPEVQPFVELHLALWDETKHRVPVSGPDLSLDDVTLRQWNGLTFPVLGSERVFLLQTLHIFKHLLACWVRMSWLLEMGRFLRGRTAEAPFWERVRGEAEQTPPMAELAAIVGGLVAKTFDAPVPSTLAMWRERLRPGARVWLDHYGREWAFANLPLYERRLFPATKLALLLHLQYVPDAKARRHVKYYRLLPLRLPERIARPVKAKPSSVIEAYVRQCRFVMRMGIFHVGTGLRYLWELPRWRRLIRSAGATARSAPRPP